MKNHFLLYLTVVLISCSNDIDYTHTYTATNLEKGSIQLFTRNGEIINSSQINNFVSLHKSTLSVMYGNVDEMMLITPAEVKFLSTTEAQFIFVNNTAVNVVNQNNAIYLESKDTFDTKLRYYGYPSLELSIYNAMLSFSELYRDTFLVNSANDTYGIRFKQCFYLTKSGNKLKMPFLNYWYFQPYSTQSGGSINNTFNNNCIDMMGDKDTLAIQQFQVVFKK
jgi:hypothetical protein